MIIGYVHYWVKIISFTFGPISPGSPSCPRRPERPGFPGKPETKRLKRWLIFYKHYYIYDSNIIVTTVLY